MTRDKNKAAKIKTDIRKKERSLAHQRILDLRRQGRKMKDIAEELKIHPITVGRWLKKYKESDAPSEKKRGRKKGIHKLNLSDEERLVGMVINNTPDQLQLPFLLWNQVAIQRIIQKEFEIDVSLRSVRSYLKRWGVDTQIPYNSSIQSTGDRWKRRRYPNIKNQARNLGAKIHWCVPRTEVKFHPGHARLKSQTDGVTYYCFKSLTNKKELQFMFFKSELTVHTYVDFLKRLIAGENDKIIAIFNRTRIKNRFLLTEYIERNRRKISLVFTA
jgi:transposase